MKKADKLRAVVSLLEGRAGLRQDQHLMPALARAISILVGARVVRSVLGDGPALTASEVCRQWARQLRERLRKEASATVRNIHLSRPRQKKLRRRDKPTPVFRHLRPEEAAGLADPSRKAHDLQLAFARRSGTALRPQFRKDEVLDLHDLLTQRLATTLAPAPTRQRRISRGLDTELQKVEGHVGPKARELVRIADAYFIGESIKAIAKKNRISESTVRRRLAQLEKLGLH